MWGRRLLSEEVKGVKVKPKKKKKKKNWPVFFMLLI